MIMKHSISDPHSNCIAYEIRQLKLLLCSAYSEITILFLSSPEQSEARRYCLALDSIVTLLSRCLTPVIYSYSLKDFTFFCLSYVDDHMFQPVFKGLNMVVVKVRTVSKKIKKVRIRLPELSSPIQYGQVGVTSGETNL